MFRPRLALMLVFSVCVAAAACAGNARAPNGDDDADSEVAGEGEGEGEPGEGEGELPVSTDPRGAASVFFVGHSLVNHNMPAMVNDLAVDADKDHHYRLQIINGAGLQYQWENSSSAEGYQLENGDGRVALATGAYDTLVITEGVPLDQSLQWTRPVEYGGNFHAAARAGNPDTQSYLYESWHSTSEPNWRRRLDEDLAKWESIVDGINAEHGGRPMLLIPAGQALGRIVDAIEAGTVPGVASRDDLFEDDIHMNALGNYVVALVHYATIYRQSPVGLTGATDDQWGRVFPTVPEATARRLQELVWQTVTSYPRSGVATE